jgi:hypothetical protein
MARPPAPVGDPHSLWALLWVALGLAALILLGVLIIAWLNHWRKRAGPELLTANEQLARFRELYEQGQLSQEEFERIRVTLAPQLRQELGVPPAGVPKEQPAPPKETDAAGPPPAAT